MSPSSARLSWLHLRSTAGRRVIFGLFTLIAFNIGALTDLVLHPDIPYFDPEHMVVGGATGLLVILLLVTVERSLSDQRKRSEALRQMALVADAAPSSITVHDFDGQFLYANPRTFEMHGYSRTEFMALNLAQVDMPTTANLIATRTEDLEKRGEATFEVEHRRRDGSILPLAVTITRTTWDGRDALLSTARDITERRAAEAALRDSEERFRATFEQAAMGIALVALDGKWLRVNQKLCDITGYCRDELEQRSFGDLTHPDDVTSSVEAVRQLVAGQIGDFTSEQRYLRKDGVQIWVAVTASLVRIAGGEPDYLVAVTEDITEHKQAEAAQATLEAQLQQAQKMESVGRLAGGVAHDFNNMLGAILGNAELALEALGPAHPVSADLMEIQRAAQRSADLTRQLLAFARRQVATPRVLNLNATVTAMLDMLRRLIPAGVELAWTPGRDPWSVRVDPSQIDQVLVNLVVNAGDAIGDVGRIMIETERATLYPDFCATHPGAAPGEYVVLTVNDTGCGMDAETLTHLFEPFFTTKETGKGTGLGLATVYGIVRQNEGFITADSELGMGSTFRVYLPRHSGQATPSVAGEPPVAEGRGAETVLLVEDEPAILRLGTLMLERLG